MSLRGRLTEHAPLAPLTTWRVGGPADRLFEPADRDDLLSFLAALPPDEPVLWLGLGSNLLVRDGGVRGTVIRLAEGLERIEVAADGRSLLAEAGAHCARVAKTLRDHALAGLGFMAGIPGTVGGALAMNAGAWGGETWPKVLAVECVNRAGGAEWLEPAAFRFGYRQLLAPSQVHGFLAARFQVEPDPEGREAAATREQLARRKATQPVGRPSAGSTFRNPPGDHAARLIEACGLKGHRIGGAVVSPLHANFILTEPGARAADVEALIAEIQARVAATSGIRLEPEVRIVGEPA